MDEQTEIWNNRVASLRKHILLILLIFGVLTDFKISNGNNLAPNRRNSLPFKNKGREGLMWIIAHPQTLLRMGNVLYFACHAV